RLQGALRRGAGGVTRAGVGGIVDVRSYRRPAMLLLHVGLATLGYPLAFFLRFDFGLSATEWRWLAGTLPLLVILKALAFWWFHISDALWRYLSMRDIMAIVKAGTLGSIVFSVAVLAASGGAFPKAVLILEWL